MAIRCGLPKPPFDGLCGPTDTLLAGGLSAPPCDRLKPFHTRLGVVGLLAGDECRGGEGECGIGLGLAFDGIDWRLRLLSISAVDAWKGALKGEAFTLPSELLDIRVLVLTGLCDDILCLRACALREAALRLCLGESAAGILQYSCPRRGDDAICRSGEDRTLCAVDDLAFFGVAISFDGL